MNRPTREEVLLKITEVVAMRGTCDRKRVGAVIARYGRIVSVGYNGAPPGLPHCDENYHGWEAHCKAYFKSGLETWEEAAFRLVSNKGCRNATHAEANALAFAARHGVSTDGAELFVSVSPCITCARLLIAAGIRRVHYLEKYRDEEGIKLLNQARVGCVWWEGADGEA